MWTPRRWGSWISDGQWNMRQGKGSDLRGIYSLQVEKTVDVIMAYRSPIHFFFLRFLEWCRCGSESLLFFHFFCGGVMTDNRHNASRGGRRVGGVQIDLAPKELTIQPQMQLQCLVALMLPAGFTGAFAPTVQLGPGSSRLKSQV